MATCPKCNSCTDPRFLDRLHRWTTAKAEPSQWTTVTTLSLEKSHCCSNLESNHVFCINAPLLINAVYNFAFLHYKSFVSQATLHSAGGYPIAALGEHITCRTVPVAGVAMLPLRACALVHLDYSACQTKFHQPSLKLQLHQIYKKRSHRQIGMHLGEEQQICTPFGSFKWSQRHCHKLPGWEPQ